MSDELPNGYIKGFHIQERPWCLVVTPGTSIDNDGAKIETTEDLSIDLAQANQPDTWYAIWVVADSRPQRTGLFWRLAYSAWQRISRLTGWRPPPQGPTTLMSDDYYEPALPSGYDLKRRVGNWLT